MQRLKSLGVLLVVLLLAACGPTIKTVYVPVYTSILDKPVVIDLCKPSELPRLDDQSFGSCSIVTLDDTKEIAELNLNYLTTSNSSNEIFFGEK